MNEFETYVKRYHTSHRKPYTFFGQGKEDIIGVELEFDSDKRGLELAPFRDACAKLLAEREDTDHYFIEKDSSLLYGFEIVTQPHSVEEMKKFFTKFSEVFPQLMELGATDEAHRAALHVHVSRESFGKTAEERMENIAKIICFIANNADDWRQAGRRKEFRKCDVRTDLNTKEAALAYVQETEGIPLLQRRKIDRYVAINLRNKNTVEFRTMQTTFVLETIFAEIDFVMHLVHRAKELSWEDVLNGKKWFENVAENVATYLKSREAFVQYL